MWNRKKAQKAASLVMAVMMTLTLVLMAVPGRVPGKGYAELPQRPAHGYRDDVREAG